MTFFNNFSVQDELSVNDPENYFQGDVDLSENQVQTLEEELTKGNRRKRKVKSSISSSIFSFSV